MTSPINQDAAAIRTLQRQLADTQIERDAMRTTVALCRAEWSNMDQSELSAGRKMAEILFGKTLVQTAPSRRALADPNPQPAKED